MPEILKIMLLCGGKTLFVTFWQKKHFPEKKGMNKNKSHATTPAIIFSTWRQTGTLTGAG